MKHEWVGITVDPERKLMLTWSSTEEAAKLIQDLWNSVSQAREATREFFEASLNEVVGRECYGKVLQAAYDKYPWLKEMPIDP